MRKSMKTGKQKLQDEASWFWTAMFGDDKGKQTKVQEASQLEGSLVWKSTSGFCRISVPKLMLEEERR